MHQGDGDDHRIRILKDGELEELDIDLEGVREWIGNIKIEELQGIIHKAREKRKSGGERKVRKKKLKSKKKIV